jgi:hypothetical protein
MELKVGDLVRNLDHKVGKVLEIRKEHYRGAVNAFELGPLKCTVVTVKLYNGSIEEDSPNGFFRLQDELDVIDQDRKRVLSEIKLARSIR